MQSIFAIILISALPIQAAVQEEKIPSILAWTGVFGSPILHKQFQDRLRDEKCEKQCNIIPRSEMTNETDYDAIVFHSRDLDGSDVPKTRRENQIYLLFSLEAHTLRGENRFGQACPSQFPPHFFNGTVGYSRLNNYIFDYDFPVSSELKVTADLIRSKTNSVFGVISNCNSRSGREEIIDELRQFTDITLRGNCYSGNVAQKELDQMMKSYRFILALENQMCSEYVTEKALRYKELIVPIVLSRKIAEEIIPSDSFIAIDDFTSTEELAKHLNRLQTDDEEYMKYFSWLDRNGTREVRKRGICQLCTDLHSPRSFFHSSLSQAAFPDDNLCISPSHFLGGIIPWWMRKAVIAAAVLLIVSSLIVIRRCCIYKNRYRQYRLVRLN